MRAKVFGMEERLVELAQRLARSIPPGDLDETLRRITAAAVEVLPDVVMSSISVQHADGRLETVAPTHDVLCEVDATQYELQEGPCYEAATQEGNVVSTDLANDERFPRYRDAALDAGIRAQVGVRLFDSERSRGALNLYSDHVGAFEDLGTLADLFREQSAMALAYAQEVQTLREAVRTRQLIGQAVGILMERFEITEDRAMYLLVRVATTGQLMLRDVAREVVDQVTLRAHRHESGEA
jgi:ANTAR domain/GAF domain